VVSFIYRDIIERTMTQTMVLAGGRKGILLNLAAEYSALSESVRSFSSLYTLLIATRGPGKERDESAGKKVDELGAAAEDGLCSALLTEKPLNPLCC
jgi:hypothetical protein